MSYLKVISDIDDTLNYWLDHYRKWFDSKSNPEVMEDSNITRNVWRLRHNRKFWLSVPVSQYPDFELVAYCTKRVNSKQITREWLELNGLPQIPIYQQIYQHGSKSKMIKGKCDVFIDDSVSNFIECNRNGVFTLLMDTPHNRWFETDLRIYSMSYNEILDKYNKYGNR